MRSNESRRGFLGIGRFHSDPASQAVGEAAAQQTIRILNVSIPRRTAAIGVGVGAVGVSIGGVALVRALTGRPSLGDPSSNSPSSEQDQSVQQLAELAQQKRDAIQQYILEGNGVVSPRTDLQEAVKSNVEVVDTLFINEGVVTANPENLPLVSRAYPLAGDQRSKLLFRFRYTMFPGKKITWQREARIRMLLFDGTQVYERWAIRNPDASKSENDVPVDELMYTRAEKVVISPDNQVTTIIDIDDGIPTNIVQIFSPDLVNKQRRLIKQA